MAMKDDKKRMDNDMLFDTLMQGGTLSQYHEQKDMQDHPMEQQQYKEPTRDDYLQDYLMENYDTIVNPEKEDFTESKPPTRDEVISDWIIGKDQRQGQFEEGGWTPKNGWSAQGQYDKTQGAWQGFGNSMMSGLNIASTLGGWIGESVDAYNKVNSDNVDAQLNSIRSQNFGIGDNASLMSQYNGIQTIGNVTGADVGKMSTSEGIIGMGKDALSGAMTGLTVGGPWGALIGGVAGLGKGAYDWISNKTRADALAEQKNTEGQIANSQVYQRFNDTVSNSQRLNTWNQLYNMAAYGGQLKSKKHKYEMGGYINSHSDDIADPLVKVEAGGTHQENPNEGVQVSMAPDGQPNLVEEGETIHDDYVFSDRIVADEKTLEESLLDTKYAGKTYADISKELEKIVAERKTDDIAMRTFDEMIGRLKEAQEAQKLKEKQEEVKRFLDGLSDEQKAALEQRMMEEWQAEQQAAQEQAEAEAAAQEQAAQEQQPSPEEQQALAEQQIAEQQPMEEQAVPSRYDEMMSRAVITDAANQGMFQLGGYAVEGSPAKRYTKFGQILNSINPQTSVMNASRSTDEYVDNLKTNANLSYYAKMPMMPLTIGMAGENMWPAVGVIAGTYAPEFTKITKDKLAAMNKKSKNGVIDEPDIRYKTGNEFGVGGHLHQYGSKYFYNLYATYEPQAIATETGWVGAPIVDASELAQLTNAYYNNQPQATATSNVSGISNTTSNGSGKKTAGQLTQGAIEPTTEDYVIGPEPYLDSFLFTEPNSIVANTQRYSPRYPSETPEEAKRRKGIEDNYERQIYETPRGLFDTQRNSLNKVAKQSQKKGGTSVEDPERKPFDYATYLRYAPAVGSAVQYLSDLFGATNRNDFSNADLLQRKADALPNVGFSPLSYISPSRPFDTTFAANAQRSANEAARRAAVNNANGNASAALAALANMNYQDTNSFGNLALQASEYNEKQRLAVDEYNSKIAQINANMSMSAQEKNQAIAAEKARLYGTVANMRQGIIDANDAAKAANMTNFYQNLGALGREAFNMNMVNNNLAYYYRMNPDGTYSYKNTYNKLTDEQKKALDSLMEDNGYTIKK